MRVACRDRHQPVTQLSRRPDDGQFGDPRCAEDPDAQRHAGASTGSADVRQEGDAGPHVAHRTLVRRVRRRGWCPVPARTSRRSRCRRNAVTMPAMSTSPAPSGVYMPVGDGLGVGQFTGLHPGGECGVDVLEVGVGDAVRHLLGPAPADRCRRSAGARCPGTAGSATRRAPGRPRSGLDHGADVRVQHREEAALGGCVAPSRSRLESRVAHWASSSVGRES